MHNTHVLPRRGHPTGHYAMVNVVPVLSVGSQLPNLLSVLRWCQRSVGRTACPSLVPAGRNVPQGRCLTQPHTLKQGPICPPPTLPAMMQQHGTVRLESQLKAPWPWKGRTRKSETIGESCMLHCVCLVPHTLLN